MKHTLLICVMLLINIGCLYDYNVRSDYYRDTGKMFHVAETPHAEEFPEQVDLDTCIRLVLERNPRVKQARSDSRMAEYAVEIAQSYIIPKVKLEAVNSYSDEDIYAAYGWDKKSMFLAKLSTRFLVYDFGIARYLLHKRFRDTDAARAGERVVSDSLCMAAAELYFRIKAMEEDIISMTESIRSLKTRVEETQVLFDEGMIPESRLLTLKVAYEELKYGKTSLENMKYKTLLSLRGMMDFPHEKPLTLAPVLKTDMLTSLPNEELLLRTALENRPEIIAGRALITSADLGIKAAKAMRWPLFLIGAEIGYSDLDMAAFDNGGVNTQVALTMSWDVYAGGENEANVKIEMEKLRKARLSLKETETDIRTEVLSAQSDIRTLREQRNSLYLAVSSAERNLEDINLLFKNQKATSSDLVQAQSSLLSAQSNLNKAEYSYMTALYKLEKSIGTSLTSLMPLKPGMKNTGQPDTEPSKE